MKKAEKIAENKNYTAVDIGGWHDLESYSFIHPKNGQTVTGKVFLKELTKSTGTEISLSTLPPGKELGYSQ